MSDNKRKLYDALSQDYDMGTFEQFSSDIENPEKRKKLYDATIEEYDFGDYDSFSEQLGFGKSQPKPSLEVAQDKPSVEQPVSVAPTMAVPTPKVENEVKQPNIAENQPISKIETPAAPKFGTEFKPPKKEYPNLIDPNITTFSQQKNTDQILKEQNRGQVAELASTIEQELNRRGEELDAEMAKNPIAYRAQGTAQTIPAFDANRTIDPEYRNYNAAKKALETAQNMIDAADANANGEGFVGGVARGFGEKFFDLNTFDMGMGDLSDNAALLKALDAYDKGELTPSQQALLDAKAVELATTAYFGSEVGRGYKAGMATAESIPLMLEMAINPAKAVGQGLTNRMARYALNKFSKKAARSAVKAAGRAIGDLAGASAMTATTGAVRTAADALDRMSGDIELGFGKAGEAFFKGHKEGDSIAKAVAKAFAGTTIENYSEMMSDYFAPIVGGVNAFGRKALDKIHLGKVTEFIDNVAATDIAKTIGQFEKYAEWHGGIGEFVEEVAGGALNAIIVGDQTLDNKEGTGVFNGENLADTAISTGWMAGFFSGIKTAAYPVYKYKANRAVDSARLDFKNAFKNDADMENLDIALSSGNLEQAKESLANVLNNGAYTTEQKEAATKYAQAVQRYNGAVIAANKRRAELQTPEQNEVETSFEQGYDLAEPQQMNDAQIELMEAEEALRRMYALAEDEDIDTFLGETPIESALASREMGASVEEQNAKLDYLNAKAKVEGMFQKVRDDIGAAVEQSNKIIDSRVNKDDSMIHPATLNNEDRKVYIVVGNVAMFDDGSAVDTAKSSKDIIVQDAETGKLEMLSSSDILTVDEAIDPEQEKAMAADAIRTEMATDVANKIDGVVPFNMGDEYAVMFDDGTQHTAKVIADNGDGSVQVQIDNEPQATVATKEQVQQMVDAANKARVAEAKQAKMAEQQQAEVQAEEQAIEEAQPKYQKNDTVTIRLEDGSEVRGSITEDADAEGRYEVHTEQPINGENLSYFTAEQLDGNVVKHNDTTIELPTPEPVTALSQIPTNENGEQVFEQAPASLTYEALVEMNEGDAAEALDTAQQMLAIAKKELQAEEKAAPKVGGNVMEIQKAKAEKKERLKPLQERVAYWESVVGYPTTKKAEEAKVAEQKPVEEVKQEVIETPVEETVEETAPVAEEAEAVEQQEVEPTPVVEEVETQEPIEAVKQEVKRTIPVSGVEALWARREEFYDANDPISKELIDRIYEAHPEEHQKGEYEKYNRRLIEAAMKHKGHPVADEILKQVKEENTVSFRENKRREPLRERVKQWEDSLGVKATVIESFDDITTEDAKAAIADGYTISGWVADGEVFFYMPNIANKTEVDKTYLHEVVAHIGLEKLMGEKAYNAFCQRVWDEVMTEEQRKEYIDYPNVDSEAMAAHEYMAHLAEDSNLEQTAWQKIVRIFKDALRALGVELRLTNEDIQNALVDSFKKLNEAARSIEAEGCAVDTKRGDVNFAVKDILKGEAREKAIKDLMRVTGRSRETVVKYLKAEESLARIILDEDNVALLDLEVDESVPSIWENSDYPQGTVEFSNICRKRLPFTMIYQQLQKEFPNTVFDAKTLETIRGILKENGEDVACGLCFVEDRRQLLGEIGQSFIDAVKGDNTDVNDKQREVLAALKQSGDSYVPDLFELLTLEGMKQLRREHPEVALAFIKYNNARGMQAGRLFQAYSAYHREILGFNKARVDKINNSGGLRIFSYSDFEAHHLIDLVQVLTDCSRKGIKVQGYTKVPEFAKAVKDTKMKLNRSLIAKGKGVVDADYVPQEGEAVSPNVINGKRLLLDTVEGINVNHPDFFDSSSSANVGNILVGISDEHIKQAMADPFVDYIIPFHSGIKEETLKQKGIGDWKNYKLEQLEKIEGKNGKLVNADKHGVNIYTEVLSEDIKTEKQFVEKYLEVCKQKGWIPKFHRLLDKNQNGDFVYTKGYYKLLLDYKLFNKNGKILPQEVVSPIFDNEFNKQILDNYVEGEKAKAPNTEVYEQIKETLKEKGKVSFRFIGEKGAANADKAEEATIRIDNLAIAREMEAADKSARSIKEATGWERGADGKWRYEVDDEITAKTIRGLKGAGLKKIQEARSKRIKELDKFAYIVTVVGVDRLYDAEKIMATSWPEHQKKAWLDAYNIYKDDRYAAIRDVTQARKTLRELNNFGKGEFFLYEALGNEHPLFKEYPQMRDVKLMVKPYKGGENMGGYNRLANTIEIVDFRGIMENDKGEGTANTLTHEIQHVIQGIEGFARGGNVNMVNPNAVKERNEQAAVISDKIEALKAQEDKLWAEREALNKTFEDWYESHPEGEYEEMMQDEQMSEADKRYSEVDNQIKPLQDERIELEQQLNDLMRNTDTSLGIEGYKRLAGEVEARNVERRRIMSLGERRNSPAWLTEDVARKDQIFIENALGEDSVQFRISDYDSEFNDLQSEYDALDKNDDVALAEWMDKKKELLNEYTNDTIKDLSLPVKEVVVIDNSRAEDVQAAYDAYVEGVLSKTNDDLVSYMRREEFEKAIKEAGAAYSPDADLIIVNANNIDTSEDIVYAAFMHEQTHGVNHRIFSEEQMVEIWEEAKILDRKRAKVIARGYKGRANRGDEYLTYYTDNFIFVDYRDKVEAYIKGDETISIDEMLNNLNNSLPLRNKAIKQILEYYRNEYKKNNADRHRGQHNGVKQTISGGEQVERGGNPTEDTGVGRRGKTAEERQRARVLAATTLAESLGTKVTIIESLDEITDANERTLRAKRGSKAWYDIRTGEVVIVIPNATSVEDVQRSVFHEVVAHKGLRDVIGRERFDQFLEKVFRNTDADTRSKITALAAKNGWDFRVATEEYMADLAEEGFDARENRTFWQKVRDLFMDMLREAKIALGYNINDNDLRYMLWRTYQMQKSKGVMAAAEDVLMQQKLGVGNFRTRPVGEAERVNARFNEQLEKLDEDTKDKIVLSLGYPSEILLGAGVKNKQMKLYGAKVLAKMKKHGFDVSELKDLPRAVANPIAVFNNYETDVNRSILTELTTKDGNFLVSVKIGEGEDVEFNIITSVFGKGDSKIANWINKGFGVYFNKEKTLNYLHHSAPIAEALSNSELSSITKIVENFVNPTIEGEKNESLPKVFFRSTGKAQPAEQTKEDLQKAIDKLQKNVSKLRQTIKNAKEFRKALAHLVAARVMTEVTDDIINVMGKSEFNGLVRQIREANARQDAEKPLERIEEIITDLKMKGSKQSIDRSLSLKVQGETKSGVSIAKSVDDTTRQIITFLKNNISKPKDKINDLLDGKYELFPSLVIKDIAEHYRNANDADYDIEAINQEIKELKEENTRIRYQRAELNKQNRTKEADELGNILKQNLESIAALETERLSKKVQAEKEYEYVNKALSELLEQGKGAYKTFLFENLRNKAEMIATAIEDVDTGQTLSVLTKKPTKAEKAKKMVVDLLLSPANSLNYLLKRITVNAPNGEGNMYDYFIRGNNGYIAAAEKAYEGYNEFKEELDSKAKDIFGKPYKKAIADSNELSNVVITVKAGKRQQDIPLTYGQAMYLYMVNKMADGKVKLNKMGIFDEQIELIKQNIPAEYLTFADWLQREFLPKKREKYNDTHLRIFGTQMTAIENYVPMKIKRDETYQEVDGSKQKGTRLPSSITGSIINRKRNNVILDLTTNALDLMLSHGQEMETWNAYSAVVRDMNALLTDTTFRNILNNRSDGLHKDLEAAANIAAEQYDAKTDRLSNAILFLSKGVVASKIAFRIWTAMKQVLSLPAFMAYSTSPKYQGLLVKSVANPYGAWKWGMENLPLMHKRWAGRSTGNEKLAYISESTFGKILDGTAKFGMMPNAFVDAVTCAVGAKAVYDYKIEEYRKRGFSDIEADRRAKMDATLAFNESQQSGEGLFLAQVQANRDVTSVALSTFQNSNFGYLRKMLEGAKELTRKRSNEEAYLYKKYLSQGLSEPIAEATAKKDVARAKRTAYLTFAMYGFILNILWTAGSNTFKYFFSDDDDEMKEDMIKALAIAPIRNTAIGSMAESAVQGYDVNPSLLVGEINRLKNIIEQGEAKKWDNSIGYAALKIAASMGTGVDIETLLRLYEGIEGILSDGSLDIEDVMAIANAPRSQALIEARKPKKGESVQEYQERISKIERRIDDRVTDALRKTWINNYYMYNIAEQFGLSAVRDDFGRVSIPEYNTLKDEAKETKARKSEYKKRGIPASDLAMFKETPEYKRMEYNQKVSSALTMLKTDLTAEERESKEAELYANMKSLLDELKE